MSDYSPSNYPVVDFDEEAWQWFVAACGDLEIAVGPEKREALSRIYSHLLGVNEWLNLTRILSQKDYLKFHVFDSLTILNLVDSYSEPGELVIDLGSGGGYPALPLMLWLHDRRWRLVDSRSKKVDFLKEAIRLTPCRDAQARAFRGREAASAAHDIYHKGRIVTARAVGKITDLLPDASALLRPGGFFIVMKGSSYPDEEQAVLAQALPKSEFDMVDELKTALDEDDPDRWVITLVKK